MMVVIALLLLVVGMCLLRICQSSECRSQHGCSTLLSCMHVCYATSTRAFKALNR
jgi:hypothetical protein